MEPNICTVMTGHEMLQLQMQLVEQISNQGFWYIGLAVATVIAVGALIYTFLSTFSIKPFLLQQEKLEIQIKDDRETFLSGVNLIISDLKLELEKNFDARFSDVSKRISVSTEKKISENSIELTKSMYDLRETLQTKFDTKSDNFKKSIDAVNAEQNTRIEKIEKSTSTNTLTLQRTESDIKKALSEIIDLNYKVGLLETDKYSSEGKKGAYLVPLRLLDEIVEKKQGNHRIPDLLEKLKSGITDGMSLDSMDKSRFKETLLKLPDKFSITTGEILSRVEKC